MRLEDMREQFPKMPESMKRMIEQEVTVQIGQEKENDNPKVVTYKKRKKKNMAHRMLVAFRSKHFSRTSAVRKDQVFVAQRG